MPEASAASDASPDAPRRGRFRSRYRDQRRVVTPRFPPVRGAGELRRAVARGGKEDSLGRRLSLLRGSAQGPAARRCEVREARQVDGTSGLAFGAVGNGERG